MSGNRVAGLVLAGGQARRMGGIDKAFVTVGGRSMIAAVLAALDLPVMAISANGDPGRFAEFGLPVLPDGAFADQGPLAGLLAGLEWAAGMGMDAVLTAPCDTPCLPKGLATILSPAPCSVASGGRLHHLVATWPVSCASELQNLLQGPGSRSVRHFAKRIGVRHVPFEAGDFDKFINVNTSDDLARVDGNAWR
jgi:molybdopterin-guanine dinucleotide biosynthesis protein A